MNIEKVEKIRADFPKIFTRKRNFECGNGWFDLIYKLCLDLEAECTRLGKTDDEWIEAVQVKQKFGQLRFYYCVSGDDGNLNELTLLAMDKSAEICETCGLKGEMRDDDDDDYYQVCCDVCHKAYLERNKSQYE